LALFLNNLKIFELEPAQMEENRLLILSEKLDKLIELQIEPNRELSVLNEQAEKIYFNSEFRDSLFKTLERINRTIETK
jgi:hypothetical protein